MQGHRARNILTVVVVALLVVMMLDRLIRRNNEQYELRAEINKLDTELVQRRAIVRDLARYRAEHAAVVARLKVIKARMSPDLDAVFASFESLGVKVERQPAQPQGFYSKHPIELRGQSKESLAAVGVALHEASLVFNDVRVSVDQKGAWARSSIVFTFVERPKTPTRDTERRWYSRVNDELWEERRQKGEEKAELDRQIGSATDFAEDKARLYGMLEIYDLLQPAIYDFEPLIRMGFTDPAPLVRWGDLEYIKEREGVQLRGPRANPIPPRVDPRCTLIDQTDGDPWTTRWALTAGTATVGASQAPQQPVGAHPG